MKKLTIILLASVALPALAVAQTSNQRDPANQQPSANPPAASSSTSAPADSKSSNTPAPNRAAAPAASGSSSAQSTTPPAQNSQQQPSAQTAQPPASATPSAPATASTTTTTSATVALAPQQQTQIVEIFRRENIQPADIRINVTEGMSLPATVTLKPVPAQIVQVAPQFREHHFFVTSERIVIVEPTSRRVVALLPLTGQTTAQTTTTTAPAERATTLAQSEQTKAPADIATVQASGQWPVSKLIGLDVYNRQNEKIGDIKDLLIDQNGAIQTAVIGVGGFVGLGTHDVALPFKQLQLVNEPPKSTTGAATTRRGDGPDHALLDASKDQLKAMPKFTYNK